MTARLFHAVTCTPERCDPPRNVEHVLPRSRFRVVHLPGCPIGDHTIPGGRYTADDLDVLTYVSVRGG